jgi:hypothetical protein
MIADLVIKDPRILSRLSKLGESDDSDATRQWALSLYPSGWGYQSKVRMNRYFGEMLARIDLDQRRWFGERAVRSSPDRMKDMAEKIRYMFVEIAVPVFDEVEKHYLHAVAFTDHARLACALERVRLARGSYPATLDELVPEFLPAVPMEVVNGKPYQYRRTDDGSFVLYSVAMNLRDDGGIIDPKLSVSKQLDWVWRYPTK